MSEERPAPRAITAEGLLALKAAASWLGRHYRQERRPRGLDTDDAMADHILQDLILRAEMGDHISYAVPSGHGMSAVSIDLRQLVATGRTGTYGPVTIWPNAD